MNDIGKIYGAGLKFLDSKSLDDAYKTIVSESIKIFDGFEGSVLLLEKGKLNRVYSTNSVFNNVIIKKEDLRHKALKESLPLLINGKEFEKQKKSYPSLEKIDARSIVIVPLFYENKPMGVMAIFSKKKNPKLGKNPQLTKLIGAIASLSIQKNKIHSQRNENVEKILSEIYSSALKLLYPLTAEETYKIVVMEAVRLTNADSGRLLLEDNGRLKDAYVSPNYTPMTEPRKKGYTFNSFSKNKALIITTKQLEEVHPRVVSHAGVRSVIFIPISNKERASGVLIIRSLENKKFTSKELNVLKIFGSLASLAIRKSELYAEIKNALDTRDLFISTASHELRTPLTSVNGYIQLIKARIKNDKKIPAKWIEDLELEGNRLKQLVEELLEINRIRTGKFQYDWKEQRLRKIIKRAINEFHFSRPQRKVIFIDELNKMRDAVIGDRNKLMQVFVNILENAAKYSLKDIKVTLRDKEDFFILDIRDSGQGISREEIPLIFKGFYRGKNSQHEGLGLGLFLAKNIVEEHKGEIKILSKIGKGTKVEIKLPKIRV